jgi:transcriptional regulator with XRE-family HTH domain
MLGETEQRERFAYALQRAMGERKVSARQLGKAMGIDARRVARWLNALDLPNLYEASGQSIFAIPTFALMPVESPETLPAQWSR